MSKAQKMVTRDSPLVERINAYLRQQDSCSVHPEVYQSYQLLDEAQRALSTAAPTLGQFSQKEINARRKS